MNNSRFDLPARNSIPVNEPGSAAYRRLQKKLKGRPAVEQRANTPRWGKKGVKGGDERPHQNLKNVQRRVKGKQQR